MLTEPPALLRTATVIEVAEACRVALRAFLALERSSSGLAAWLEGAYRDATRFAPQARLEVPSLDRVDEAKRLIRGALSSCTNAEEFARRLPRVVHVVPVRDMEGDRGFVPTGDGHLVDRLFALVVADMLTRPNSFFAILPELLALPTDVRCRDTVREMRAVRLG